MKLRWMETEIHTLVPSFKRTYSISIKRTLQIKIDEVWVDVPVETVVKKIKK